MPLARKEIRRKRFEDFPLRLFFNLLSSPDRKAELFLGPKKWHYLKEKWQEGDDSMENDRMLEDQKKTVLPMVQAQKALLAMKWLFVTESDPRPIFEELGLPWNDDPKKLVETLVSHIERLTSKYENNLIQLQATQQQAEDRSKGTDFHIDDVIATLNLAGFTIPDKDALTIGDFRSMTKTMEKNGRRQD